MCVRILSKNFVLFLIMSSVQLKFINVAAVNCQYCCSNQQKLLLYPANVPSDCNLSTSVRCMQVEVVKNTILQMYYTRFTSLSYTWLSEVQTTTGIQLGLEHLYKPEKLHPRYMQCRLLKIRS